MKSRLLKHGSFLVAVLAVAGAAYSIQKNPAAQVEHELLYSPPSPPGRDGISSDLSLAYLGAVGLVEPSSEAIAVATNVSGVVAQVVVGPGSKVKTGDPLFVIDDRTPQSELEVARADLQAAEARLKEVEGQVAQVEARVHAASAFVRQATLNVAERQDQLRRVESLGIQRVISDEELNTRRFAAESAAARLTEAEARLKETTAALLLLVGATASLEPITDPNSLRPSGPTIAVQQVAIVKARAAVTQAETKLALCIVRSPVDGSVLQVRVRVGEYAQAAVLSEPLMVIGVVDPLHVRAEIDEAEIGRFSTRAAAYASLRGQANRKATLRFLRVEPLVIPKRVLTGAASERVDTRVLQVIYVLSPGDLPAMAGQQVDIYIEEGPSTPRQP